MRHIFTLFTLLIATNLCAQYVGIGTIAPTEKLDVNGNVNIAGTIKANGIAGQAGQVLKTSNTGVLEWGSTCQFSNFMAFNIAGGSNWTIPAGVTKILVEAWGGGGGGSGYSGGGGGGYARAQFYVKPGTNINVHIGLGGWGGGTATGTGQTTTVALPDSTNKFYTLSAFGGQGGKIIDFVSVPVANGGSYSIVPEYSHYTGSQGSAGLHNNINYIQSAATTFLEIINGGKGGDGGNTINTGGVGAHTLYTGSSYIIKWTFDATSGLAKGGGGGGGILNALNGVDGGNGAVIIWY